MSNPIKMVAENPDPNVELPLSKEEMTQLVEVLSFFNANYNKIVTAYCGTEPEEHIEAEGWAICESDICLYFEKAKALMLRIQKLNMPKISDDIYECLQKNFSNLEDSELRRALKRILKTHLKVEDQNE